MRIGKTKQLADAALLVETDACVVWPFALDRHGYPVLRAEGRWRNGHVYICEKANGQKPTKAHQAAHSCGVRACYNKRHLSWKTPTENSADQKLHGTWARGTRGGNSKLSETDVRYARNSGKTLRATGDELGVSAQTIHCIRTGKTWGHTI